MGMTSDILRTWRRGPRPVVRDHLAQGAPERRSLAFLMIGCLAVFVAQWPRLARESQLDGVEIDRLVAYAMVAWLIVWPLLFYLIAGVVHLASRRLGGEGTGAGARLAMFWSWLAATPLGLLTGALAGLTGASWATNAAGIAWLGAFAAFWAVAQREAAEPGIPSGLAAG